MSGSRFKVGDPVVIDPEHKFLGLNGYWDATGVVAEASAKDEEVIARLDGDGFLKQVWDCEIATPDEAKAVKSYTITVTEEATGKVVYLKKGERAGALDSIEAEIGESDDLPS